MRSTNFPTAQGRSTFEQAFDPKNNAFGFLRLVLAVLVIFSHSFPLGGFGLDRLAVLTGGRYAIGSLSVAMFFVLSGFLICRSASTSRSVPRFLWHRFLRIFPGYWACLVVCAFVFAPLMALAEFGALDPVFAASWNSPHAFVMSNAALFHCNEFSLGGILFIRPNAIANLLNHNPVPGMFNGSLWSLPFEFSFYLAVAALTAVGVLRRARFVVLGLFAGWWGLYAFDCVNPEGFNQCFPYPGMKPLVQLSVFFSAGCVCFLYREKIPHTTVAFAISLIALAVSLPAGVFGLVAPIALTYAFLWLAFTLPFAPFDTKGDFSYGTYIYAYPVQQGLALLRLHEEGFGLYFTCSLLLTSVLAFLSYWLIEAPCLRLKTVNLSTFRRCAGPPVAQLSETCASPSAARAIP